MNDSKNASVVVVYIVVNRSFEEEKSKKKPPRENSKERHHGCAREEERHGRKYDGYAYSEVDVYVWCVQRVVLSLSFRLSRSVVFTFSCDTRLYR